jgi:hypothetical protein
MLAIVGLQDFHAVVRSNYMGYQIFLGALFAVFGPNLLVALIANNALILISIICLYRATLLMTESPRAAMLACLAFMLTTVNIFYSLMLLKEPALGLAFALILLAVAKVVQGRKLGFAGISQVVIALLIIVSMRATLLIFFIVLGALVGGLLFKRRAHIFALLAGMVALIAPLARNFTIYELDASFVATTIVENRVVTSRFEAGDLDLAGVAGLVIGIYINLPFLAKVLLFPIPVIVQMLLPFDFWSRDFLDYHFASFFARNLNPLWYMFVVVWVAFSVAFFRRIEIPVLKRFLLAGVLYYIAVAVIYGGLIPRYAAPVLFFVYPAVGYWWHRAQQEPQVRQNIGRFFGHYYAAAFFAGLGYLAFQTMR